MKEADKCLQPIEDSVPALLMGGSTWNVKEAHRDVAIDSNQVDTFQAFGEDQCLEDNKVVGY